MSGVLGGLIAAFPTPITGAFESIATATGTGSSGTITFSSIPSTYQHLQIRGIARTTTTGTDNDIFLQFNGVSTTTYDYHYLRGNGTAASASGAINQTRMQVANVAGNGSAASIVGSFIIDIHDYASTTKNKTVRSISGHDQNGTDQNIFLFSGLSRNTAAVSSISIIVPTLNFTTASTFALFGIKGA